MIENIRKRTGEVVVFDPEKIKTVLQKAFDSINEEPKDLDALVQQVVKDIEKRMKDEVPSVEDVSDNVETVLMQKHPAVAKSFIIFREYKRKLREIRKVYTGSVEKTNLSLNAIKVLEARYLLKDNNGNIIETPNQLFDRVSEHIANADKKRLSQKKYKELQDKFFDMMYYLDFLPNTPALMNAGTELGMLSACFVLPVGDSMSEIFDAIKYTALIQQSGGGCIVSGSKVFTSFCGLENIDILYEKLFLQTKTIETDSSGAEIISLLDKDIKTISFDEQSNSFISAKVNKIWKFNSISDANKIITKSGTCAITSAWHPFFVIDKNWNIVEKRADEVKQNDLLLKPDLNMNWLFNEYKEIDNIKIDEDVAWLIGFALGDGSLGNSKNGLRFRLFDGTTENLEFAKAILLNRFNIDVAIQKDKRELYSLCTTTAKFTNWIKENNILTIGEKLNLSIPSFIIKSPKSVVCSFLAGLIDSDGYVDNRNSRTSVSTICKDLADQILHLLSLLGLRPYSRVRLPKRNAKKDCYEVTFSVSEDIEKIKELFLRFLKSNLKKERLAKTIKNKHTVLERLPISFDYIENIFEKIGTSTKCDAIHRKSILINGKNFWLARFKEGKGISKQKLIDLLVTINNDETKKILNLVEKLDYVVSAEKTVETKPFYDFTVEKYQNYLSGQNGFTVIHNTGFSFSRLRPKGSFVKSTKGIASGPISFMKVFDAASNVIKQGGRRRGANMGVLRVDHPDILEFISCKQTEGQIPNFNISVAVTDLFMKAVENNCDYDLIDPHNGEVAGNLNARSVFDLIANMAWQNGEPGIIFIDEINRHNQVSNMGVIESTNPCHRGTNKVHTDIGLLPIKELLNKKFSVLCPDGKITPAKAFSTGKQKIYRIKFDNGLYIDLTKNHNLISYNNEKIEVKDLKKGTKIVLSKYGITPNRSEYKFSTNDGFVLGWNYGNGWISWHSNKKVKNWQIGFVFGKEDKEIYSFIKKYCNKLGIDINGCDRLKTKGVIELATTNKIARDLFLKKFKAVSKKEGIPITVLRGNREFQKGFLNGLFSSDGNVHSMYRGTKRVRRITLTSAHTKLIEDVQLLLSTFGIVSRVRYSKCELNGKEYDRFDLHINGKDVNSFAKSIGFKNKNKQKKLNTLLRAKWGDVKQIDYAKVVEIIDLKKMEEVYNLTVFNKDHKFAVNGIISANCGEQVLLSYESCNLGSVNLANMIDEEGKIDWKKLEETVRLAIRFMDNMIDVNKYLLPQIERMTKSSRKIGLGVMGWADMLLQLQIPYNSDDAIYLAEKVMKFITDTGIEESVKLGEEKGNFPAFKGSYWDVIGYKNMRNATITTIAPTGTISMIADVSSGIEPLFSLSYTRLTLENQEFVYTNKYLEQELKRRGIYSGEIMQKIAKTGMFEGIEEIPGDLKKVYITAREIDAEWHIKMQAAFQKYIHNAVSKTINMPNSATVDDVKKAYRLAYESKCKGLTIYRDASRQVQILNAGTNQRESDSEFEGPKKSILQKLITKEIPKDECSICHAKMVAQEGCYTCPKCSYSKCS